MPQPPSGGCVLKLPKSINSKRNTIPAAFGRLCVETAYQCPIRRPSTQPPSGGCVLKHSLIIIYKAFWYQPPSGGCVLKRHVVNLKNTHAIPAAFGRLCVETLLRLFG